MAGFAGDILPNVGCEDAPLPKRFLKGCELLVVGAAAFCSEGTFGANGLLGAGASAAGFDEKMLFKAGWEAFDSSDPDDAGLGANKLPPVAGAAEKMLGVLAFAGSGVDAAGAAPKRPPKG